MFNSNSIPFVSIIITTLNEQALIKDCLISVMNTNYPSDFMEIIVVDNGSKDRTVDIVKKFPVRILHEYQSGICYCRNKGIENSKGDILLFTDPDCIVSKNWIELLIHMFQDDKIGIVAGGIVPFPGNSYPEKFAAIRRSHSQERPINHPIHPFGMTPNLAFRKIIFNEIGLFDTRFSGGGWEDTDICWRYSKKFTYIGQKEKNEKCDV